VSTEISLQQLNALPSGVAYGSDGNLYVTLFQTSDVTSYNFTTGTFSLFATKVRPAGPNGITLGPDNDIWLTETSANQIATISAGTVHEFPLTAGAAPANLTSGPSGNLYFTEPGLNAIGLINATVQVAAGPYSIPTANAGPLGIATGPDNHVWFTESTAAKIGRFNPLTTSVDEEIPLPAGSADPTNIVLGPDGAMWFTENNPAGPKLGRLATATGTITEFALTGAGSAMGLAVGLDNNLYFTDPKNNAIGAFTITTQKTAEYPIPTPNSSPTAIALNPANGKLYFTERTGNKIGQFTYF
jgi:virginiamycin B lyase